MEDVVGRQLLEVLAARAEAPVWRSAWRFVAFLGAADFFAVALPLLFAWAPARWSLRIGLAFASSAALSETLKAAIGRARPDPAAFGLPPLEDPGAYDSAALPSGHTLMAVVLWGTVAWRSGSTAVRVGCGLLVAAIAFSRLALLRHDLLDVGAGLVFGGALLAAIVLVDRAWSDALRRLPRVDRATLWLLVPLVLQMAIGLEVTGVVLGVGAGLGVGVFAFGGWRRRTRPPHVASVIARAVLALAGVAGARAFAEPGEGFAPLVLFGIYFTAAVWVAGVVPALLGGVHESRETPA